MDSNDLSSRCRRRCLCCRIIMLFVRPGPVDGSPIIYDNSGKIVTCHIVGHIDSGLSSPGHAMIIASAQSPPSTDIVFEPEVGEEEEEAGNQ